ncbi:MAG: glycosyltransferase family 4 protein [Chlorobiaceae bacterium]|nr:glycosyltransferase family 4 protein [Chlorobiaceae bacterium]
MKVLLAIPCLMRGGTEMQTLYLARALAAAGHRVTVVCYFEVDQTVVDEFVDAGCKVELLRLERGLSSRSFIGIMKAFYRKSMPDILHVQYMTPGALSIIAARLAGIGKVFATVHQPYTQGHGQSAYLFLRVSALLCDRFMAVSKVAEASWFGSSKECVFGKRRALPGHCTIHNAVDTERVAMLSASSDIVSLKERYGLSGRFVFGYIGRLSHEKGVDILVQAFGEIAGKRPSVSLLVVGTGLEGKRLEERFGHEAWWRQIVFVGGLSWEDAMRHLAVIDALVVPSRFEGFGLSAVEAMAASKPVIAARTGGLMEIIEDGYSGLLYEIEDFSALARLMLLLIDDAANYRKLSVNARKRALDFDVEVYSKKIQNLYNQYKP